MNLEEWALQCQWDAACRALMQCHPVFGVATAEMVGGSTMGFAAGWNRFKPPSGCQPDVYVYISGEHGISTSLPPEAVGTHIHDVPSQALSLRSSTLWNAFVHTGNHLARAGGEFALRYFRIRRELWANSTPQEDWRRAGSAATRNAQRIRDAWERSTKTPVSVSEFEEPALQCVREYLNFQMNGDFASDVLGAAIFTLCTTPCIRAAFDEAVIANPFLDAVEHLAGVMDDLLNRRRGMNVPSYMKATYLAALYGKAASHLISLSRERATHPYVKLTSGAWIDRYLRRLDRLKLNVEEMLAHHVHPTFILPALYSPRGILRHLDWMGERSNRDARYWAEYFQIDPALREMQTNRELWENRTEGEVTAQHMKLSDTLLESDVGGVSDGGISTHGPLSDNGRQQLLTALVANQMGNR